MVEADDAAGFERVISVRKERSYTAGKIVRGWIGPQPIPVLNYSCAAACAELHALLAATEFDTVQLVSVHLIEYLNLIRAVPRRPAVIMDWHNIESELMFRYAAQTSNWVRRAIARRTAVLLQGVERRAIDNCDGITVVSERERTQLRACHPNANVHVVRNGMDCASYSCPDRRTAAPETLLFVGSMDYYANVDAVTGFVREVWPELSKRNPGLTFVIAGSKPTAAVRALASDRVRVTGTVDDIRPFYRTATVVVVPLRVGGGTRLKILEAMAAGVPVVSTRLGAEGLTVEDGKTIRLADSAGEMVISIDRLLHHEVERAALARAASALVRRTYDWNVIGRELYGVHTRVADVWAA